MCPPVLQTLVLCVPFLYGLGGAANPSWPPFTGVFRGQGRKVPQRILVLLRVLRGVLSDRFGPQICQKSSLRRSGSGAQQHSLGHFPAERRPCSQALASYLFQRPLTPILLQRSYALCCSIASQKRTFRNACSHESASCVVGKRASSQLKKSLLTFSLLISEDFWDFPSFLSDRRVFIPSNRRC